MSIRLKVLDYLNEQADPNTEFIPFINERAKNGTLLVGYKSTRQPSVNNIRSMVPIKNNRSQSNAIEKSSIDPLFYLSDLSINDKLTQTQIIALKKLQLVRDNIKNNQLWKVDSINFKSFVDVPLDKKIQQLNYITKIREQFNRPKEILIDRQNQRKIKLDPKAIDPLIFRDDKENNPNYNNHQFVQNTIKKVQSRSKERRHLSNRSRVPSQYRDYLDFSIEPVKPKTIVNIVFKKEKRQNSNSPIQQEQKEQKPKKRKSLRIQTYDQTKYMYERMIRNINLKVQQEQRLNPHKLLHPQEEFTYKEISPNFAQENCRKLKQQAECIDIHREKLKELSQKLQYIITYRRYGERDLEEDELIREGKMDLIG